MSPHGERIEDIRRRRAAIPDDPDWMGYADDLGPNQGRCEMFAGPKDEYGYRTGSVFNVVEDCECGCSPPTPGEMGFIANAPSDIDYILAALDAATARADRAEAAIRDERGRVLDACEKALTKDADPSVWWFVGEAINRIRAATAALAGVGEDRDA